MGRIQAKERIHAAIRWALIDSVLFYVIFLLALELMPGAVLRLFNASEHMLLIGIPAVRVLALAWLVSIPNLVVAAALQGLSLPTPSMILTMLRQAILPVALALLLRLTGNLSLVWWAFVLAEGICVPLAFVFWQRNQRKVLK